ncbi:methyltransferase domain-containing protein [Ktedonosporobacter rubrisoli]|uniref:Methyltransferase domain-containing protein n=1 Tax=Ktedonosporobacter rubrisoli TaxID=2509675 RepID=A0A4P6JIT6_KTERU|nr:methyltransferase domain-containing protein [Ktedonosporobacter rubrisoli]QBD74913.1 methyltransferase domain-containing protein [Ktedonosporobacter rubrisoli]
MQESQTDKWAQWLIHGRWKGDSQTEEEQKQAFFYPVRNTLLNWAKLEGNETVLDIGCGDGLLAFGALERLGPGGKVIFSDISSFLLDHCRMLAEQKNAIEQCQFLQASAEDLRKLADNSIDVITIRSVLIYVQDKQQAFSEFYRVLRQGGRVVLFEPINRFKPLEPFGKVAFEHLFWGYDVTPIQSIADKVQAVFARLQPWDTDPMFNFDERDMLTYAQKAGFNSVDFTLNASCVPGEEPARWDIFLKKQQNPLVPMLQEALQQALSPDEMAQFEAHLRPLVEAGQDIHRHGLLYLRIEK